MKKILLAAFLVLAAVWFLRWPRDAQSRSVADSAPVGATREPDAVEPSQAAAPRSELVAQVPTAPSVASTPIPLIDPADPAFAIALTSLARSFESTLARDPVSRAYTKEQLEQRAKLLAVARLSQSMYEATIAAVTTTPDVASISIPQYRKEGEWLKGYVLDTVVPEYRDESTKNSLTNTFFHFGQYPQQIEAKASDARLEPALDDERFWSIHYVLDFGGGNRLQANSTLGVSHLGSLAPFAGWFPKL